MQTLVEIGPFNASQGQHRRKDATGQMKNQTLSRTRTQVLGFLSTDALPTNIRVPVGRTRLLIPISFQILDSLRCLPFMWTFIPDMLLLSLFFILHNCPLLIPLYNTAVLINLCRFLINVANICKPLSLPLISRYCILHCYIDTTLVDFILKHNPFVLDDEQYLQINGTAMGKKCHLHTPIFLCITLKIHFFLHLI